MVEISGLYEGDKHCVLTHGPSKISIHTDAPIDHEGRGEAFSPTDLLAAAYGSCLMTVMAIYAENNNINLRGSSFKVNKEMKPAPRQVNCLEVELTLPESLSLEERKILEKIAYTCPVKLSLNPEIKLPITFHYKSL
jgi:putative redox protein